MREVNGRLALSRVGYGESLQATPDMGSLSV